LSIIATYARKLLPDGTVTVVVPKASMRRLFTVTALLQRPQSSQISAGLDDRVDDPVVLLGAVVFGQLPFTPLRTPQWILLGVGFSTVGSGDSRPFSVASAIILAAFDSGVPVRSA